MTEPHAADPTAAQLRALRGNLGLSQEQLARRLGVSFATVNRWESGRTRVSARATAALAELEAQAAAQRASAGALPVAGSSFVGRERELAELSRLLRRSRLVTLTGPGGAGKTRLAVEVLRRDVADAGVVFVPLDRIGDAGALPTALAFRLHVADQPGTPLLESLRSALAQAQAPRTLLLDGAERIAADVASLAADLLRTVPGLRIVVTSRVVLGVPGELCWTVPPLACPSVAAGASDIVMSDAVRLFVTRASDRVPDFRASDLAPHAIAELCRRLDGLPLAIELIAGWVGTLSIREILQQRAVLLDHEPGQPGGRRLADVLQVSYDLLSADQQRRLAMLSVFAGTFAIADIEAVLGLDPAAAATTARLLVDSSWLVVTRDSDQNLFSMLETIRTFAAHRLAQTGDQAAARERHARHFAAVATASESALTGPDAAASTKRLEWAADDLHVALAWAEEHGDVDLGLTASAALWRWWLATGRLAAGRTWLASFLRQAGSRHDGLTGRALCSAAVLAAENGDYAAAVEHAEQALAIFGRLGLTEPMALAATVLGSAQRYLGDHEAARRSFQKALDLRTALGDRRAVSIAINNIALVEMDDGNLGRARELLEQALAVKRDLGEQRSIGIGLANLADLLIKTGEWERADEVLAEAAIMTVGHPQLMGIVRCNQGLVAAHRRDLVVAAGHFRAAIDAAQSGGHPHDVIEAMIGLGRVCHEAGQHDEAVRQLQAAKALAAEIGNPQHLAAAGAALTEIGATVPAASCPADRATAVSRPRPGNLTSRQAEVLALAAAGLTNRQIAAELYLSTATVERHLATIYRNLGLSGRVEATRFALENGVAATRPR